MNMQLQQLGYFLAVAEERHFTRAAERAHVAQPSLSKQIQLLERELGAPLFNRARGNITLTPAGEALLPIATRILADVERARDDVQQLVDLNRGRLRLGATPSLSTVVLPEALRRFHDLHPGVELQVEEGGSRDLVRLLANGAIDLALVVLPLQRGDPALALEPILKEPLVVAARNDGALANAKAIRLRDLRDLPLVMFREGYDLREATLGALRRQRIEPVFAVEGGEMDAVLRFVEAGLGIAVVPAMVVATHPTLRAIPIEAPALSRTIALARRRDVTPSAAATAFRSTLLDHLARAE